MTTTAIKTLCPGCKETFEVPQGTTVAYCPHCDETVVWRRCSAKGITAPVLERWPSWTHPGCPQQHPVSLVSRAKGAPLTTGNKWAIGLGVLVLLGAIGSATGAGSSSNDHGSQVSACQDEIRAKLKAPATARFGESTVREDATGGGVVINGPVDSENGFGALIRSAYVCNVDSSGYVTDSTFIDGGG